MQKKKEIKDVYSGVVEFYINGEIICKLQSNMLSMPVMPVMPVEEIDVNIPSPNSRDRKDRKMYIAGNMSYEPIRIKLDDFTYSEISQLSTELKKFKCKYEIEGKGRHIWDINDASISCLGDTNEILINYDTATIIREDK